MLHSDIGFIKSNKRQVMYRIFSQKYGTIICLYRILRTRDYF